MGSGRAQRMYLFLSTSFHAGCLHSHVDSCGALLGSPVMNRNASRTHLFPNAPQAVRAPAGSVASSSLPQLLGPLRPLSSPAHPRLVLTDVTLTLSSHGIQVPGPGGVCGRTLGLCAESLGEGGQQVMTEGDCHLPPGQIKGLSVVVLFSFPVASC